MPWANRDSKFKNREDYSLFIEKQVKNEKNLNGDAITEILENKLKKKYVLTKERNYISQNINPFDLVAGDEETLEMVGFEIKGDTDDTKRLMNQLDSYMFACNEVYVVFHKKKAPVWLPREIGVLRVTEKGEVFTENPSWSKDPFEISSIFEWEELFKLNNLGNCSQKTKKMLEVLQTIRRNILFNRFFAKIGWNAVDGNKYYPFSDKQRAILIGLDIPYHYKKISRDLKDIENRIGMLKSLINMGQKGVSEYVGAKP